MKTGGKGGNDAELIIGAVIDGAGLQKSWDEAFKGLKTPELASKKVTEGGKKLLDSILPKDAVAGVNRQITELEKSVAKFQELQGKLAAGKLGKADSNELRKFLKPFSAFTEGLAGEHAQLQRVGQLLQGDVNSLGKLYKSIADLNRNAPASRKNLDLFAGLTDKDKLKQSAANIRTAQDQLAQQKQLIADLSKVHKAALAAGQTDFAKVLGGQIGLQQAQYTKDRGAIDLVAAQKRVNKEIRDEANAAAKERAKQSVDRVKAQQKQDAAELAAYEKGQQALLASRAKYRQILRDNAAGVSARTTLPAAPGLDLSRVTKEGASGRVSDLQAALKLVEALEKRYSAMATQQQAAGKSGERAVQSQARMNAEAQGYRAELEKINSAIKHNRDALAEQKRLGREMAKDVEAALAKELSGKQKLSEMDRAAMAAQIQRQRRRDAEMARIRRANQVDTGVVSQVHAGTSALTLSEQAAAINKAIALNKALVAQYDKVILSEQALGKQTQAMEAVRAKEAAALDKNIKKQDELTAAIKKQTKAQEEADKAAKKVSDFNKQRISGQDTRDRRYRYEKAAADDRLFDRRRGRGPNLTGTVDELRQQNVELANAAKWHDKMAQALQQEENRAKNLGIGYRHISQELANHVLAIKNIAGEQEQVNKALREQGRLERQSIKNKTDMAAKIQANIAGNRAGHQIVGQRGGYSNFNTSGLSLREAKLASEALNQMAAAMKNNLQQQAALGQATQKMRDNLDKVSNSARRAKEELAALQKEAASAHGMKKFNQELLSTIKNFAKFAVVYQGLYAILGYVRQLAGAVYDLNTQLANMQAITGDTAKSMEAVSVAILQVSSNARFTIQEMTEAAKVIAQAGKSVDELPRVLQAVSDFAAASDTSLATSADIITSIGEVYKELSETDIANQLTKAVNLSKLSGEDLKTILSIGAQVGEGYNITADQMLAAASTLRNAGIKASTIATGMRQAMVEVFNLQDNSAKSLQEAYAKIGEDLSLSEIKAKFSNFKNEADPLLAVLKELKKLGFGAGGDFTIGRAFDLRALNVLKALSSNTEDYLKLQKEITFGQPAAESAAKSMESLNAQLTRFSNLWSKIMSEDAGGLLETLAKVVKGLNDFLEKSREARDEKIAAQRIEGSEEKAKELPFAEKFLLFLNKAVAITNPGAVQGPASEVMATDRNTGEIPVSREEKAAAAQRALAVATKNFDDFQNRIKAYDPAGTGPGSLNEFITNYENLLNTVSKSLYEVSGGNLDAAKQIKDLTIKYGQEGDSEARRQILNQINALVADGKKLADEDVKAMANDIEAMQASSSAAIDNFQSFYNGLVDLAAKGDELAANQLKKLHDADHGETTNQLLQPEGFGKEHLTKNIEAYQSSMAAAAEVASVGGKDIIDKQITATMNSFEAELAVAAATPNGAAEAAIESVVRKFASNISMMGAGFAAPALQRLQETAASAFSLGGAAANILQANPGGGSVANVAKFIPGITGYGGGNGVFPNQRNLVAEAQKAAADKEAARKELIKAEYDANHIVSKPKLENKEYIPDVERGSRLGQIDLEITKLQKFGDATNRAADLINERAALQQQDNADARAVAQHNLKVAEQQGKESSEYRKASADLANLELEQQKIQLQNNEDYLDNMQKNAVTEMQMYDQQKATILAAGGNFEGLAALNDQYMSTQSKLITEMEDYMRNTLNMTEAEIQRYIESRPELKKGLLSDKDYNSVDKKNSARIKAAEAAIPKTATTGDALMDAKARAGLGFTNEQKAKFAASKTSGIQNSIALLNELNANDEVLKRAADPALAESIQAKIDERTSSIRDMNTELEDLAAEIQDFSSTASSELASVFNEEGIQAFTVALQSSGNALKDWGDNIRDSLLTAWDSVGDAIAGAVLEGEDFVESMKKITRDLAKEVFTMTTKNMMNNLLLGAMTGSYGGATQPGQQPGVPGGTGAAPAPAASAGGFLSSVTSALGITPAAAGGAPGAAGSAVGTMTVNAGVVNVNGAAGTGGAAEGIVSKFPGLQGNEKDGYKLAAGEIAGPPAPEKSLFQVVEDKISSGMDSVMSTLESAFKGLDQGLGGLLSGIGNMASSMFKGVADFDWGGMATKVMGAFGFATGAIIPMKFAGGYVSKSGMIKGPGSGTSDSIRGSMYTKSGRAPIAVSSGESILTAKATSLLGEKTIKSLNAGTARKFSTGGMVAQSRANANSANLKTPSPSVTVTPQAPQNIQMINTIDSDSVVQAGLSSPASVKTLMNVIRANKSAFKQVLN